MTSHTSPAITPAMLILYVNDPAASAVFYRDLLEREPLESSPTFALFALECGLKLGLWSQHNVQPAAGAAGGGAEICFIVPDRASVEALHADWRGRGLRILQAPVAMDFGFTFVAADPDGHRLRVYVLEQE